MTPMPYWQSNKTLVKLKFNNYKGKGLHQQIDNKKCLKTSIAFTYQQNKPFSSDSKSTTRKFTQNQYVWNGKSRQERASRNAR
jgi:hypothetical protein